MATDTSEGFHVAIVGAGIGGLALAMALNKKAIPFTLYEEASQFSVVGAGIGFGPNGLRAMDSIEPSFRARYDAICVGNKSEDAQHVFFEGLLLEQGLGLNKPWFGKSSWGHPNYTRKSAHRKELLDIMTSYLPAERVKFNKSLTKIEEDEQGVLLTFADGEVARATILVGAEGIQSTARKYVLEHYPSEIEPVYAGSYCYRAVIPISDAKEILGDRTDVAKFYFGKDRGGVTYRISGGKEFNFLLCVSDRKPWAVKDAVTEKVSHDQMMADFGDSTIDERFRQLLSKAKPIKWGLFHHQRTSTYYRGRVVLVGDSAHASLPFQAAGAGQGVEDGFLLSHLLEAVAQAAPDDTTPLAPTIAAAFTAYDTIRRPRAQRQLEQSAEVSDMLYFQNAETGSDMSEILARMQHGRFDWLWFHDLEGDVHTAIRMMEKATT